MLDRCDKNVGSSDITKRALFIDGLLIYINAYSVTEGIDTPSAAKASPSRVRGNATSRPLLGRVFSLCIRKLSLRMMPSSYAVHQVGAYRFLRIRLNPSRELLRDPSNSFRFYASLIELDFAVHPPNGWDGEYGSTERTTCR
jgi:hypothetical protein